MMRRKRAFQFSIPFAMYGEMGKLGMQTQEMLVSSAVVILHRSHMIGQAMTGQLPWTHPEFLSLWQEKILAAVESSNALNRSFMKQSGKSLFAPGLIKAIASSAKPYHKKAKANAMRLSKKRRP